MHYLSETYGEDVPRQIWQAAKYKTTPDALQSVAFAGTWEHFGSSQHKEGCEPCSVGTGSKFHRIPPG
jgi:hypothetical protein